MREFVEITDLFSSLKATLAYIYGLSEIRLEVGDQRKTSLYSLIKLFNMNFLLLETEKPVKLVNRMAGDALIQLYHNFITDFETKINLLKLAHFAVIVSRQYSEKDAAISYLEDVIEKLQATREMRIEEPILFIKMQIAIFNLEKGSQKECKKLLEDGKSTLDTMTDIDPSVYASYYDNNPNSNCN
ncbi:26S proteasome non-ATPase regulatory subunit 13 homolog A-like [Rhododendron vialii]|uniref:26S proteasome non-ATPase regulatory subunit 13 homolog A-like n=1 Tax=Rhododendron vialii TaxID=182163 RepID=UPI00265F6EF1|nr:26S proteasome non-ATPase regulatory subunit 13 homolog A-like [Rhododendron vialii]